MSFSKPMESMFDDRNKMFIKVCCIIFVSEERETFEYSVIVYLILFQMDSIGMKLLRGFIYSSQLYQMHQVGD